MPPGSPARMKIRNLSLRTLVTATMSVGESGPPSAFKAMSWAFNSSSWAKVGRPVKGRVISEFGTKPDGGHNDGIDLAVPQGTSVKAAENGVVAYAGNELRGFGNWQPAPADPG